VNTTTRLVRFGVRNPRRNLPAKHGTGRQESNFVSAFADAYLKQHCDQGRGGKQFALSGFGIADFVWLSWNNPGEESGGRAVSVQERTKQPPSHFICAFEMKLTNWRKGLTQAYRYSYFADCALLVLPPSVAKAAATEKRLFRKLNVGLWSFDKLSGQIAELFSPKEPQARNPDARQKAIQLILGDFNFGKSRK
jgi:hypothetical protein